MRQTTGIRKKQTQQTQKPGQENIEDDNRWLVECRGCRRRREMERKKKESEVCRVPLCSPAENIADRFRAILLHGFQKWCENSPSFSQFIASNEVRLTAQENVENKTLVSIRQNQSLKCKATAQWLSIFETDLK